MKNKILGIFVCILLIVTVLPTVGKINKTVSEDSKILVQMTTSDYIPGEFIVKFTEDSVLLNPSIQALNDKYQVISIEKVFKRAESTTLENIYILQVPKDSDILSIVSDYGLCPNVMYAEPNYIGYLPIIPNDYYFEEQWSLNNSGQYSGTPDCDIDAPEAWDIEKGDSNVVIASVDTGVDYNHEDIADNIWTNDDEIPDNGIDDDDNGYVDDIIGWDFADNDNDPMDDYQPGIVNGHGTRCAGVHSAVTNNNIGVAGVCWYCKTMIVRCNNEAPADQSKFAQGIKYAADNAADIINIEIALDVFSNTMKDAVDYAYSKGCFILAAAGNLNTSTKRYPAAYDNVIAIAATNQRDERCDESDWGQGYGSNYGDWIDVAAPGNSLWLLHPDNNYIFRQGGGTSLAAPHVAGLAGLLLSFNPKLSHDELKEIICDENNVDPYESNYYIGTGRINAYKALQSIFIDLECDGSLSWVDVKPGGTVTGNFTVQNVGGNRSLLDWEITDEPSWGEWTFNPNSGVDLSPEDGVVTVEVSCVVPNVKGQTLNGRIKVENLEDSEDCCNLDVTIITPKNKSFNFNFPLLNWLFERFPKAFPILRYMMGL